MAALPPTPTRAIEVFYSYAHTDEPLRTELDKHLSLLRRQGMIAGWHDRRITAGAEWAGAIDAHLQRAQIILLLVSADFLASDYCYDVELQRALERHEHGEARVIPIILRPCDWMESPFGKLQALPRDAKPVTTWSNLDEAFLNIALGIRAAAKEAAIVRARTIAIAVEAGDALAWPADVLALKYAQALYGVDLAVFNHFLAKGVDLSKRLPKPSRLYLTPSQGVVKATTVLFVGVEPLFQFGYEQIRQFGRKVLTALSREAPESKHVVLTVHGPGYGLDETEAFESMVAGLVDAVTSGDIPERLERLTIIERNIARASRLSEALSR